MAIFNEDMRVKIPATIQFLRLGYEYQSLREADIDFNTKIFINRFKPALEKINCRDFSYNEIYQMRLLAFMQLEHADRKEWLEETKNNIVNIK